MAQLSALMMVLVTAVKAYAIEHYETGAWDTIVECYADDEIAELIGDAVTEEEAIHNVREELKHYAEYRREIQNTAF